MKVEYIPPAEDIDKVMMVCSGEDKVMLQRYYFTFARRGEIFNRTWEEAILKNNGITHGQERDYTATSKLTIPPCRKIPNYTRR